MLTVCVAVEAEAVNVDDRCESDISGVATDDTDLSSMSSGADIAMEMGSMVYRHQPNPVFNTLLTCCTVLMLCFTVGIGVGHYFGQSLQVATFIVFIRNLPFNAMQFSYHLRHGCATNLVGRVPQRQPHHCSGLATLPSVGAIP